jgi:hypothetical protein
VRDVPATEMVAAKLNKPPSWVARRRRLLNLIPGLAGALPDPKSWAKEHARLMPPTLTGVAVTAGDPGPQAPPEPVPARGSRKRVVRRTTAIGEAPTPVTKLATVKGGLAEGKRRYRSSSKRANFIVTIELSYP